MIKRDCLDETFSNRWIERNVPTLRPPCSPDITPLAFFLWDYIKDRVYASPVADCDYLKARLQVAVGTVTEDMLQNIWREVEYRLDIFQVTKGTQVKIYYHKWS